MTFTQKYSRKQIRRERPILTNSCPYGIVESETKYLLISSVVCFAYCWRRSYGAPFICVACNEWKALPHNSSAALAMSFPPSAACKFLDLHPVNLRNLHLHLTKNPFVSRLPHCAVLPLNLPLTNHIPKEALSSPLLARAHLLTTCKQQTVVSLPLVGLVHSPMGSFALCGERQEIRQTSFPARKTPLLAEVQQRHFS